jgi:hypothetical protein
MGEQLDESIDRYFRITRRQELSQVVKHRRYAIDTGLPDSQRDSSGTRPHTSSSVDRGRAAFDAQ